MMNANLRFDISIKMLKMIQMMPHNPICEFFVGFHTADQGLSWFIPKLSKGHRVDMADGLKFACIFFITTTKEKEGSIYTDSEFPNHTAEFPNQPTCMVKGS